MRYTFSVTACFNAANIKKGNVNYQLAIVIAIVTVTVIASVDITVICNVIGIASTVSIMVVIVSIMVVMMIAFFFSRAFLTAECSVARTVLLVSLQALGTMLAIYIPAAPGCAEERAKSKPVSLQKGWKSAVVGGAGDFSEDLTDGRGVAFEVVAAR